MPSSQNTRRHPFVPFDSNLFRTPQVNTASVIEVQNIWHTYNQGSGTKVGAAANALQNVTFNVMPGEIFGLLGPNGGGKTTLFRILSTLLSPASGHARILGEDVVLSAAKVRNRVGIVFQTQSLDRKLSVTENLIHQGHLYGMRGTSLRNRIQQVLEQFRLIERASERVETLSEGMKRRVELAKGFLHKPRVLLLDEPSTGLDPGARLDFWRYLEVLNKVEGATVLLTTHFMDEAEKCHRLAILDKGKLVAMGSPEALKTSVGGDVIVVRTRNPEAMSHALRERFGDPVATVGDTIRIERPKGHEFVAELFEAFPGRIEAVTVSKPSLEDVFIHQTGHVFWDEDSKSQNLN